MFNKKLPILAFLIIILTSNSTMADRGGVGNGESWHGGGEGVQENFGFPPGREVQQNLLPRPNNERQELQLLPEQIKRNYNQVQREQRQQFQQYWKRIKK